MKPREIAYSILGMAIFLLGISSAHAAMLPYEEIQVVTGPTVLNPIELEDVAPGIYEATLVDFEFPVAFKTLALGIVQEVAPMVFEPLGIGFGTGSFTFNVSSPGTIFANVVAIPGTGGIGAYGLQIKAIPIPPAAVLLLSGLIGLVLVGRRDPKG